MTEEDRELFLIDLFPRFVYGVKVQSWTGEIRTTCLNAFPFSREEMDEEDMWDWLDNIKPYLRPISNMTKEEEKELRTLTGAKVLYGHIVFPTADSFGEDNFISEECWTNVFDWLNAHHFDFRGLIERGLALKAPESMYRN